VIGTELVEGLAATYSEAALAEDATIIAKTKIPLTGNRA